MKNSLMYKMSYYRYFLRVSQGLIHTDALRFAELYGGHPAQDRVRGQKIPATSPTLDILGAPHFETKDAR